MSAKKQKSPVEFDMFDPYAPDEEDISLTAKKKLDEKRRAEIARRCAVYRRAFRDEERKADLMEVMLDLSQFCRLNQSTYMADDRGHALLEGRREVAQRIMDFTQLDHTALFKKYHGLQ
jgi:hypothetical protein